MDPVDPFGTHLFGLNIKAESVCQLVVPGAHTGLSCEEYTVYIACPNPLGFGGWVWGGVRIKKRFVLKHHYRWVFSRRQSGSDASGFPVQRLLVSGLGGTTTKSGRGFKEVGHHAAGLVFQPPVSARLKAQGGQLRAAAGSGPTTLPEGRHML